MPWRESAFERSVASQDYAINRIGEFVADIN